MFPVKTKGIKKKISSIKKKLNPEISLLLVTRYRRIRNLKTRKTPKDIKKKIKRDWEISRIKLKSK